MVKISKIKIKSFLIGIIIGLVLANTGVYAAIMYQSSEVGYDNSNSGLTSQNVQDALDELYEQQHPPAPDGEVIQFSYEGNTYQFEAGMTWAAWLDTEYNLDGFDSSGNYVLDLNGNFITKDGNNREQVTNIITATEYYIHR